MEAAKQKTWLNNLLTGGMEFPPESPLALKVKLYHFITLTSLLGDGVYILIQLINHKYDLLVYLILVFVIYGGNILLLRWTKNFRLTGFISFLLLFVSMPASLILGDATIILWYIIIPLFLFFLFDTKLVLYESIALGLTLIVIIILQINHVLDTGLSLNMLSSTCIAFILAVAMGFYYSFMSAKQYNTILNERAQVNAAKARDEAILESISDGVLVINKTGEIIFANHATKVILNLDLNDPTVRSQLNGYFQFYKPDTVTAINEQDQPLARVQRGEVINQPYFVKYPAMVDGIFLFMSAQPVITTTGEDIGAVFVIRDITKEQQIDRAKTEFVSLASHQLRTPLTAINWYAEMILSGDAGKISQRPKSYLQEILQSSQRMVALVSSLLNVSRLELGTFIIDNQNIDVIEHAKVILSELQPQIQEKKLNVTTTYDKLKTMAADPKLLDIIFQNLLSNAVKYTPVGGSIRFNIEQLKAGTTIADHTMLVDGITIVVADTGYGIPYKQQHRIFSKLFRADNVIQHDVQGNGLGLYIVQQIVQEAGGMIWFESQENKGTTFYVFMPLSGMRAKSGSKKLS